MQWNALTKEWFIAMWNGFEERDDRIAMWNGLFGFEGQVVSENKNSTATNRKQSAINSETSGPLQMEPCIQHHMPSKQRVVVDVCHHV